MEDKDMDDIKRSCIDCGTTNCNLEDSRYPEFCLTKNMKPEVLERAMAAYEEGSIDRKLSQVSASIEHDGYMQWTRVEEIMEFSKRMGYKKLGIATCVGLIKESRTLAQILRGRGFEVYSIACKCGVQKKQSIGCNPNCDELGENMCNPSLQAELLNEEGTDFNIVMGLCVGHDSIFYRHSKAPVTTLVAKDRVLGHNPCVALYQADFYYKRLKENK